MDALCRYRPGTWLQAREDCMAASKTPVSGASSYREIGEYWDEHDLSEANTHEVEMDVDIQSSVTYFSMDRSLAEKLRAIAAHEGLSPHFREQPVTWVSGA